MPFDRRSMRNPNRVIPGRSVDFQLGGVDAAIEDLYKHVRDLKANTPTSDDVGLLVGVQFPQRTVAGDVTLTTDDYAVWVNTTSGDVTVTLPSATGIGGQEFRVKKISTDSNSVIVATQHSQEIDGATTAEWTTPYLSLDFMSNGSGYYIC